MTIQQAFELAVQHHQSGRLAEAEAIYRQILAAEPRHADALHLLGVIAHQMGRNEAAVDLIRQAIALAPGIPDLHSNLGIALQDKGQLDEAVTAYRRAVALDPHFPNAHSNLGTALLHKGQLDEAIAAYRQAIALEPNYREAQSNLLVALNYHPGFDAPAIAREQRLWNQQHAEPLRQLIQPHPNDHAPERRLRIGYVSPDFRAHVVGYNMLPLLANHDRDHFEIFCYAQVARPDALTDRFRAHAHHWRGTIGLTDEQLATQVREDQIPTSSWTWLCTPPTIASLSSPANPPRCR